MNASPAATRSSRKTNTNGMSGRVGTNTQKGGEQSVPRRWRELACSTWEEFLRKLAAIREEVLEAIRGAGKARVIIAEKCFNPTKPQAIPTCYRNLFKQRKARAIREKFHFFLHANKPLIASACMG
jgi:hypothetical protein